jgi:beta-aspartyl-dipeptidase (metallo-type)
VARRHELFLQSLELAKMGGYIDITCESFDEGSAKKGRMASLLKEAKEAGVPMDHVTMSSDGQGSWSTYDAEGHLVKMGVTSVGNLPSQLKALVKEDGMALEEALTYFTSNVAKSLEIYPKKGCIAEGADADLLLWDPSLELDTVIAKGKTMMEGGALLTRGTYEHD